LLLAYAPEVNSMKKIIGGLLVMTILTSPSYVAKADGGFDMLRALRSPVYVVWAAVDNNDANSLDAINQKMSAIDANRRRISVLLDNRNQMLAQIQTKMDFYSQTRAALPPEKINAFANFMSYSADAWPQIKSSLNEIGEPGNFSGVSGEIMSDDTDYEYISVELSDMLAAQESVTGKLNAYIGKGNELLEIL